MTRIKILCCDDEILLLEMMSDAFNACGFITLKASSGNAAIELLKTNAVDIIITDMRMPDGDGLSVIEFVKNNDNLKNIPVVVLTGMCTIPKEVLLQKGAAVVFSKPVKFDLILDFFNKNCTNLSQ